MENADDLIEAKILQVFERLSPPRQKQLLNFTEFLIWKEQNTEKNAEED